MGVVGLMEDGGGGVDGGWRWWGSLGKKKNS